MTRVLFYCQHLLGIGHLKRAATVSRSLAEAGFDVTLVSGGHDVPGLALGSAKLVQLPPMRAADKYFRVLVDETDREIDEAFRERRRTLLLEAYATIRPEILITELYPFGRRQLSYELLPLLEAARADAAAPLIVSSVRDILVEPPKPERVAEMLERIERYFDLVLVHGDPKLIPFEETFPLAHRIAGKLRYTGYVVERPPTGRARREDGEVLVSAGGGAVSEELFRASFAARGRTVLRDRTWRALAGHALPEPVFSALREEAPDGFVVERARPDFVSLLAECALSISQGGYNTVMEVLAAGTRGVIVPYAGGLETEQTLRARVLGPGSGLQVVEEDRIGPETISRAVDAAMEGPPPAAPFFDCSGAETTVTCLRDALAAHRSQSVPPPK